MKIPNNLKKYLSKEKNLYKLDLSKVLFDAFGKVLRANLKQNFVLYVREFIVKKYTTLTNFCKNEEFNYRLFKRWIYENKKNRSSIPLYELQKIAKIFGMEIKHVYDNIENFQLLSGNEIKFDQAMMIDNEFAYGLGLYVGEGINEEIIKSSVGLTNTEIEIIEFILMWFVKYFRIDRNKIKIKVEIQNENEEFKRFLSQRLYVSEENINFRIRNKAVVLCINIVFNLKIVRLLIDWMKRNIVSLLISDLNLGIAYSQGVLDGEGNVTSDRARIRLRMNDTKAIDVVEIVYRKLGTTPRRENDKSLILEARDFPKLAEINPFRLHKERIERFNFMRNKIKHIRSKNNGLMEKCLDELIKEAKFITARKLATRLGYSDELLTRDTLKQAEKLGYVATIGKGSRHDPWRFKITPYGKEYLKSVKSEFKTEIESIEQNILNRVDNDGS